MKDGVVTTKKVMNGILFFDDWHYVLDPPNGLLHKDPLSRTKFLALLKNLGVGHKKRLLKKNSLQEACPLI